MAEKTTINIKDAIKVASEKARNQASMLDRKALDELTVLYRRAVDDIRAEINRKSGSGGALNISVLNELLRLTEARLNQFRKARDTLLENRMIDAAKLGAAPALAGGAVVGISLTGVAHDAVLQAKHFIAKDGLQLSDRIWRIDNHARQVVSDAIQYAIVRGHSATQAALDFIDDGQAVPLDVASKISQANSASVNREIIKNIMGDKGTPYDNALRLFRTEINRAHGNAYQASVFSHPDVIGTRFLLSPNHPKHDICDMHASANLYGLGAGVYPEGKNPYPAHPNTLSFVEAVFKDEVTAKDKAGKTTRMGWLEQQSQQHQNSVLGLHKAWMLREGYLKEYTIDEPWSVLKKQLEKMGVTIPDAGSLNE
ncbi:MAG: hypothetical protein COA83_09600 [Methylophaga sp.]|nr:MAG: hypothetical protein COA83_09600 [Methylophaga sp.]